MNERNRQVPHCGERIKSNHDVKETTDRLENMLHKKGMTVFTRINHTEGTKKFGKELRPKS